MRLRLVAAKLFFLSMLLVIDHVSHAKDKKLDFSEVTSVLQKAVADGAFPGCAVAVGSNSGVVWSAGFGHFDFEHSKPATKSTIYDLASLTKVVGTTAVYMRLSAQGKINLADTAGKFVPEFIAGAANDEEKAKREKITIEQLLTHTGGIASWKPFYRSVNSYSELLQAIHKTPLESDPGEKFRYSDPGMMLLGEIASRATGKKLPELEHELVFGPLKMRDTYRNPSRILLPRIPPTERWPEKTNYVHGIVHDENSRAGEGITGHAGLFSTTEDLSKLAAELLRACDGKSKLFPRQVAENFTRKRGSLNRGLGWGIASQYETSKVGLSKSAFGHTGFTGTSIWIDPERKLFIILLSNRVHPTRDNNKISRVRSDLTSAVVRVWEQH
ncbi:MAG: beta-lactamase family protein [Verrucomicrobia bacterium]|nr:beta-lactamase family protein [Verrucomicrobiota bacterium]